ncbi:sulfurtransferase TusA [Salinispirillum marinum]|uniref:Sulfurtransferase TusA n=2 Tax=Saccharospirillaceae TaxID=255527 RepID=A0ABV8B914_9GAMM
MDFVPPSQFTELDTSGLKCPEPVMMLHANVRQRVAGDVIKMIATDPSTQRDVPKFCHFLGHTLLAREDRSDDYIYWIEIAAR